jgi:hypothetical protein
MTLGVNTLDEYWESNYRRALTHNCRSGAGIERLVGVK